MPESFRNPRVLDEEPYIVIEYEIEPDFPTGGCCH